MLDWHCFLCFPILGLRVYELWFELTQKWKTLQSLQNSKLKLQILFVTKQTPSPSPWILILMLILNQIYGVSSCRFQNYPWHSRLVSFLPIWKFFWVKIRVHVDIPTCHFSERFWFRTVFVPKGCFSERVLFRKVFTPKIRDKNLSE